VAPPQTPLGSLLRSPDSSVFKGPTSKGRGRKGRRGNRRRSEGIGKEMGGDE